MFYGCRRLRRQVKQLGSNHAIPQLKAQHRHRAEILEQHGVEERKKFFLIFFLSITGIKGYRAAD
ncbi:MAG: hypothetical protein HDT14_10855 [Oscillibacter sp.]|nr:hypothetical protein [Oscillibacter sp.]